MDRKDFFRRDGQGDCPRDQLPPAQIATVFGSLLLSSDLDQDSPHGLRGGGKEMPPAVPMMGLFHVDQADVRVVDQGRGLQSLVGGLLGHFGGGQLAEFVVDQGQKLPGGAGGRLARWHGGCG